MKNKSVTDLSLNFHSHTTIPTSINGISCDALNAELSKGMDSLKSGKTYTPDEVDVELMKEFGI